jgi:hypothetical protein
MRLEFLDLEENTFSVQGYLELASSLPNVKGLRQIDFSWTTFNIRSLGYVGNAGRVSKEY